MSNVPIDEARRSCQPDVVITINVGSPLIKAEDSCASASNGPSASVFRAAYQKTWLNSLGA